MSTMIPHRVEDILDEPDARLLIERVQTLLDEEAKRRLDFYEWVTPSMKAEFINGGVVMHSPALRRHLNASINLSTLLHAFVHLHELGEVDVEKAMVSLTRNDYEPDICFWGTEKSRHFEEEQMQHPAPDLVVEVLSKSTEKNDRGVKFKDYAAHGVTEYWLVDPRRQTVEQHQLDTEFMAFEMVAKLTVKDSVTSLTVLGFTIPVRAIFDKKVNLETLGLLLTR